jgi:hypothetical protein
MIEYLDAQYYKIQLDNDFWVVTDTMNCLLTEKFFRTATDAITWAEHNIGCNTDDVFANWVDDSCKE